MSPDRYVEPASRRPREPDQKDVAGESPALQKAGAGPAFFSTGLMPHHFSWDFWDSLTQMNKPMAMMKPMVNRLSIPMGV